ncbi:hypothetical protein WA158_001587 [Blastocystis sp. Blastoise]
MDSLKARLEKMAAKEKAIHSLASENSAKNGKKVYMTNKQKEEAARKLKEEEKKKQEESNQIKRKAPEYDTKVVIIKPKVKKTEEPVQNVKLPLAEVIRRFRLMGEPITLFGETEEERIVRLREIELIKGNLLFGEDSNAALTGQKVKNIFLQRNRGLLFEKDAKLDDIIEEEEFIDNLYKPILPNSASTNENDASTNVNITEETPLQKKIGEEHDVIGTYFKSLLKEWHTYLDSRSDSERNTMAGRKAILSYQQCKDYLIPFFRICRHRGIPDDIRKNMLKIVEFCKEKNYKEAYSYYLQITVGVTNWSIGVAGIGIHERANREKLQSDKISHVMNDDTSKKIFTMIHRLMSVCQQLHPTDPSKMIS